MDKSIHEAIIKTLSYADVFDYPMKLEEIEKWLIITNNIKHITYNKIREIQSISEKNGYYFLQGRETIIEIRQGREKYSQEKLKITKEAVNLLKLIPTVKLIGVTGAMAMENAKKDDDMDLFIVSSPGFLWTTRFLATLLVEFLGMRRHPEEKNVNDKICLNMFSDEDHLSVSKQERDLFTAHEVLQMKPLFDRGDTYRIFLQANNWVRKYLPNAIEEITLAKGGKDTSEVAKQRLRLLGWWRNQKRIFGIFESFLKNFQLWYMHKRRTTEIISDGILRFHPHDVREWVMREYKKRVTIHSFSSIKYS